jgi:prevent-host-death family protein
VKKKALKYPAHLRTPDVLKDAAVLEGPVVINVRAAKDSLSSLIERAANGLETIITSDGVPKAKLVPVQRKRKPFHADWELLKSIPIRKGSKRSEDIIREERDSGY